MGNGAKSTVPSLPARTKSRSMVQSTKTYWVGADLVIEIVSPDDRGRDTVRKRREYAQAGIPEYWLVDPAARTITVLVLAGNQYHEHGTFVTGSQATSPLLPGFLVDVSTLFAEAEG